MLQSLKHTYWVNQGILALTKSHKYDLRSANLPIRLILSFQ